MHRFFTDNIDGNTAYLNAEDSVHAVRVLRLCCGDTVCICDGSGSDYDGTIVSADKSCVMLELSGKRPTETESHIKISLIQCLPKTGKMEVIIQKCVELGVCDFYPVLSSRCVVKPDKKSASAKIERYNKVAYEAAKQSVRGIIPVVHPIGSLADFDFSGYDFVIIPYEDEKELTLKAFCDANAERLSHDLNMAVIIGPEGGFEKDEVDRAVSCGGVSVTLGKRILRTETAGMACVAMLMGFTEG